MKTYVLTILLAVALVIPLTQPAKAMGDKKAAKIEAPKPVEQPKPIETPAPEPVVQKAPERIPQPETTAKPKEKRYQALTRATLSQLYWVMGHMDPNRDADIDNFLKINKCDLYKENFNDDFAWHEIRQDARVSLIKHKDSFSKHIQIIQPIYLGRYNVVDQTFPLTRKIITKSFEVKATDEDKWACKSVNDGSHVWRYPHRAIMQLANTLKLTKIEVPIELAGQYNNMHQTTFDENTRPAYMVKKLRVFEASPVNKDKRRSKNTASISAVLESIDIYGDKARTFLIYSENMRKRLPEKSSED